MADDLPSLPLDRLEKAASCLRPIERKALVLRASRRLSEREIGALLGISPKKVERILARAISKLVAALDRIDR